MRFILVLLLTCAVATLDAASSYIGVVVAGGKVLLNHSKTAGNPTVFEGNSLETAGATCRVRLAAGGWAQLGIRSTGRLFDDHVELESGSVRLSNYSAAALGLRINAANDAVGTVLLQTGTLEVSAITGALRVYSASGLNVASVLAGQTLRLEPAGLESSRAPSALPESRAIRSDVPPPHPGASNSTAMVNSGSGDTPHLSAVHSQAVVANALPAEATPHPVAIAGGFRISASMTAQGVSTTRARSEDDDCLSADRDCKHGHDPGDDGHGHGNDDHGHGHGHDH